MGTPNFTPPFISFFFFLQSPQVLYKYPQRAFPYERLLEENARRNRQEPEFELVDTGIFDDSRYFDVFVEYCKGLNPDDILIQITAHNRAPDGEAELHLLPQLFYRNTWSWRSEVGEDYWPRSPITVDRQQRLETAHPTLGRFRFECETLTLGADDQQPMTDAARHPYLREQPRWLFTENETNQKRIWGLPNRTHYVKDAFHEYVVHGKTDAVRLGPYAEGTKVAAHHVYRIPAGKHVVLRLRLYEDPVEEIKQSNRDKTQPQEGKSTTQEKATNSVAKEDGNRKQDKKTNTKEQPAKDEDGNQQQQQKPIDSESWIGGINETPPQGRKDNNEKEKEKQQQEQEQRQKEQHNKKHKDGADNNDGLPLSPCMAVLRNPSESLFCDKLFDQLFVERKHEAEEFYAERIDVKLSPDELFICRQALAGLLWSKQFYNYVVLDWLDGDDLQPPPPKGHKTGRNSEWVHVHCRVGKAKKERKRVYVIGFNTSSPIGCSSDA
jgi:hypothetical protein